MKKILISGNAPAIRKVALAIFCITLLTLTAAPARATDVCTVAGAPAACGVTITISGTAGNLVATITGGGVGSAYDTGDDEIVGLVNNSNVKVGAIILSAPSEGGDNAFQFDNDGPCDFFGSAYCFGTTHYEGPNNDFVGLSPDKTTGKVLFKTPIAGGGSTWFALEAVPTNVVAIGENRPLTANSPAVYVFGPFSTDGGTNTRNNHGDDFQITPLNSAVGDTLTVTAVPVPAGPAVGNNFGSETLAPLLQGQPRFSAAAPFANLSCIPYDDFSTSGNPTCVEIELDCPAANADACNFLYTTQLDYAVDGVSLPNPIGGIALIVQHDVPCPATAFTENIFLSYKATQPGNDPPLRGGGSGGHSCYVAAFDPNSPQPIPFGTTVSTFGGFEFPSNTKTNPIIQGLPVPLLWAFNDNAGSPVKNLRLCKNLTGSGCTVPWVNLSLTALTQTTACQSVATANLPSVLNSGLLNLGKGQYAFIWDTFTKTKGLKGCQVRVVLHFNTGGVSAPALFQYAL